jgi:putative protease
LDFVRKIQPDALIISDPGILNIVKREIPEIEIHLSTQANVTNYEAAQFWFNQGVKRIILAREVGLDEIKKIKEKVPELDLEYFVHGAMCMSYSGRCILSKWMTNRSANLGDCSQPCRWRYHKEEKREIKTSSTVDDQNRFKIDIEEDQNGTYLFNSYDLNLIEHLKELIEAGVSSFKIEGRSKSVYYSALANRAYRKVLDAIIESKEILEFNRVVESQKNELNKLSNRGYWTGFLLGDEPPHLFSKASVVVDNMFIGISWERISSKSRMVFVHNHFNVGDQVEIITPQKNLSVKIIEINLPEEGGKESAHGGLDKTYQIRFNQEIKGIFLMRKVVK